MRKCMLVLLLALSAPAAAEAQTGKRFSLGAGIDFKDYSDSRFGSSDFGFTPMYRFSSRRTNGWDWDIKGSLNFSKLNVPTEVAGGEVQLGELRTIPLLLGVARTYRQGPMKVGAYVMGGPSFNDFEIDDAAQAAYQSTGAELEAVHAKTSFAFKPGLSATYDLMSWLALKGSFSYTIHRPTVRTLVDGVSTSETWKLDHSSAALGMVVGLF